MLRVAMHSAEIKAPTASLKDQAAEIQKVSSQLELTRLYRRGVFKQRLAELRSSFLL
jgi:hypothetical protein